MNYFLFIQTLISRSIQSKASLQKHQNHSKRKPHFATYLNTQLVINHKPACGISMVYIIIKVVGQLKPDICA